MGAKVSLFTRNTAQMKEFCAGASFYGAVKSAKNRSSIGGYVFRRQDCWLRDFSAALQACLSL